RLRSYLRRQGPATADLEISAGLTSRRRALCGAPYQNGRTAAVLCPPIAIAKKSRSRPSSVIFEDDIEPDVSRRKISRAARVRLLRASKSVGHRHSDLSRTPWVQSARDHFGRIRFFTRQTRWRRSP